MTPELYYSEASIAQYHSEAVQMSCMQRPENTEDIIPNIYIILYII